ncbi:Alpha/Beta hydrolase protein [Zopfochytrium polystomum]|nr:Alpha/Beta hydrolase protein [Zopfochytrium polystomum]
MLGRCPALLSPIAAADPVPPEPDPAVSQRTATADFGGRLLLLIATHRPNLPPTPQDASPLRRSGVLLPSGLTAWNCTTCTNITVAQTHSVTVISSPIIAAQAFVAVSEDLQSVVVAFRGTYEPQNYLEDLNFATVDFDLPPGVARHRPNARIHSGFYLYWQSIRKDTLAAAARLAERYPDYTLLFTGHSLGGAVATLAALTAAAGNATAAARIALLTVGAPRIGDAGFAAAVAAAGFASSVRAVNYDDVAVHLPPRAFGFRHGGAAEVWIDARGDAVACDDGGAEDRECANSVPPWVSASAHLVYDGVVFGGAAC